MLKCCGECLGAFFCCYCCRKNDDITAIQSIINHECFYGKGQHLLFLYGDILNKATQKTADDKVIELNRYNSAYVRKIVCGSNHCIVQFNDKTIGVLGSNQYGQLGKEINQKKKAFEVFKPNIPLFDEFDIWDIAAGEGFSLILVGKMIVSRVFFVGSLIQKTEEIETNDANPFLHEGEDSEQETLNSKNFNNGPYEESCVYYNVDENLTNISKVYAFGQKFILVSGANEIYIGGEDFTGNKIDSYELLYKFPTEDQFLKIALGLNHCLILFEENKLYGIGDDSYGQLSLEFQTERILQPKRILKDAFEGKIIDISAGENHSVILLDTGEVYCFGDNSLGQCGGNSAKYSSPNLVECEWENFDASNTSIYSVWSWRSWFSRKVTPEAIKEKKKISKIFSGYNHNFAVASGGEVFVWGDASYGKLGLRLESNAKKIIKPLGVPRIKDPNQVSLGKNVSIMYFS